MIISRTPLRMSFVGGGSDLPSYYREYGGAVVSTAIDKYVYVTMNRKFDSGIRVAYSRDEEVSSVSEIDHQLVRAALNMAGVPGGVEITTVADIPSRGTGLGSSSSFTVSLLHALYAFIGRHSTSRELADQACHIEIDVCGEPIGKQDQYAAAYGGRLVHAAAEGHSHERADISVRRAGGRLERRSGASIHNTGGTRERADASIRRTVPRAGNDAPIRDTQPADVDLTRRGRALRCP